MNDKIKNTGESGQGRSMSVTLINHQQRLGPYLLCCSAETPQVFTHQSLLILGAAASTTAYVRKVLYRLTWLQWELHET